MTIAAVIFLIFFFFYPLTLRLKLSFLSFPRGVRSSSCLKLRTPLPCSTAVLSGYSYSGCYLLFGPGEEREGRIFRMDTERAGTGGRSGVPRDLSLALSTLTLLSPPPFPSPSTLFAILNSILLSSNSISIIFSLYIYIYMYYRYKSCLKNSKLGCIKKLRVSPAYLQMLIHCGSESGRWGVVIEKGNAEEKGGNVKGIADGKRKNVK
ncbi:hypothetical protein PUN28_018058 [Cardiocondyla obscurior]|uniref:ATP synthase F0 subunit 8 n=1 Tax=Cardiocondyla obscurior TaxID=286306 RepID=A0AAW2EFL5_9HYME